MLGGGGNICHFGFKPSKPPPKSEEDASVAPSIRNSAPGVTEPGIRIILSLLRGVSSALKFRHLILILIFFRVI